MKVVSCANETKWRELQKHMMQDWERAPRWRVKRLPPLRPGTWDLESGATEHPPANPFPDVHGVGDTDWYYHFRSFNIYKELEWVDMKPRTKSGMMTLDDLVSCCRNIGFDFEVIEDFVRVYGYRRLAESERAVRSATV